MRWRSAPSGCAVRWTRPGSAIAGFVDTVQPFRSDGVFSAKAWLKHRLQLSGPEAFRRVQTARMHARLPLWASGAGVGQVGVAQSELMGQLAANPRIDPDALHRGGWELFMDALDLPFKQFEANVRMWERLADVDGAEEQAERNRTNRDADIRRRTNGSWVLSGSFDDIGGVEFAEIFGHYLQAEFDADWAEARERVGDTATMLDLRRTQSQRRGDALLAMARAAAACPPWSQRPLPLVNYLIDDQTYDATLAGERIDPLRYRDVVCRSQSGHEMNPADVVALSLIGHIRRVVYDATSVIIDLGRKQRLFKGASREAVMLLATGCAWAGCDAKAEWCQADHSISWKQHGAHRAPQRRPIVQTAQPVQRTGLPGQPRRPRQLAHPPPRRTRNPVTVAALPLLLASLEFGDRIEQVVAVARRRTHDVDRRDERFEPDALVMESIGDHRTSIQGNRVEVAETVSEGRAGVEVEAAADSPTVSSARDGRSRCGLDSDSSSSSRTRMLVHR